MSQVFRRGPKTPEMNLTPLIDVVFQLIIFFMLINNIIVEEIVEMSPPDLTDPQTQQVAEENRVIVNLVPPAEYNPREAEGLEQRPGMVVGVKVFTSTYSMQQLDLLTDELAEVKEQRPEVQVLLRADAGVYYEEVQPVMQAIAQAKIDTVHLVAYLPEDQR